ncbi:MAG: helix-turn-helix domain-containing protein [Saccharofermentanales bacterium]|jgi:transcriptional regulator with XRE-family HTH domain
MTTGEMIKQHRKRQNLTLKEMSEKTGLSTGYLSLVERNQSSLTLVSLKLIASALNISPTIFLNMPEKSTGCVIHQDEYAVFRVEDTNTIFYDLSNTTDKELELGPIIMVIMPGSSRADIEPHVHSGEEFGYVLEGVLTLFVDGKEYVLYPGDSFHFSSTKPHVLLNFSNKLVRLLYVLKKKSWSFNINGI